MTKTAVVAEATEEVVKAKRVAPTNSPLPSVQPIGEDEVGAPELAKMLGADAREFRGFLRATKRNMETEKGTRYAWKKGSPEIEEIMEAFKAFKAAKPVKEPKAPTEKKVKAAKAEVAAEAEEIDTDLDEVDEISVEDIDI